MYLEFSICAWRDGTMVKDISWSYRRPEFDFQYQYQVIHDISSPISEEYDAFFWTPQELHLYVNVLTHNCAQK